MSVDVAAANGVGVVAGRTTDGERGATTVGVIAGRASALTASEATVPDESAVGVMSRGSISAELPGGWGRVSGGFALEGWSSGQGFIEGRLGYQAGNYRAQWGAQVAYDDETGLQVNNNLSARYSQGVNAWAGVGAVITDEDAQAALDYVGSFFGYDEETPAVSGDEAVSGAYAGSEFGTTGFEGSPEVGPDHAAAVNEAAESEPGGAYGGHPSGRTGFEGSPEVGPDHAAAVNEAAAGSDSGGSSAGSESGSTGFEGSPEVGAGSYSDSPGSSSDGSGDGSSSGSSDSSSTSGGSYAGSESGSTGFEGSPEVGGGSYSDSGSSDSGGYSDSGGSVDSGYSDSGGNSDSGGSVSSGSDANGGVSGSSDSGGSYAGSDTGSTGFEGSPEVGGGYSDSGGYAGW